MSHLCLVCIFIFLHSKTSMCVLLIVNRLTGGGKPQTTTFQGVRVRNSVKEILMQIRNSKRLSSGCTTQEIEGDLNIEQYIELKAIFGNRKRPYECPLDEPACKRPNYQIPLVLTPPDTPNAIDMEDTNTNENSKDSNCEILQNIINIKNESSPVSLNTVQVNWMSTVANNEKPTEEPYQDDQVQQFQQCQRFQTIDPQSLEQSLMGAFAYLPESQVPFTSLSDCSQFNANDQMPTYQQSFDTSGYCDLYWSDQNIASLLNETVDGSCGINLPVPLHPKNRDLSQSFGPVSNNANFTPPVLLDSCSISPLHSSVAGNQASHTHPGKSFFQWQLDQEERKMGHITQEQLLAKDSDGDTFLHIAVAHGRRALSYVLARKMAAINRLDIKEHNNQSALQIAVVANQHLIVQDLVGLGAEVNTTDCWGRTPLHVCAEKGYSEVLQAIQKGVIESKLYVDTEATNYEGLTALHCAVMSHNAVVHQLPKSQQPHTPAVHELLLKTKSLVDTIRNLIHMGASVDARDRKSGRSVLHLAAEEANLELLRLFLDLPNSLSFVNAKAYNGNTPLHIVASLTHLDAVRLLMRKGADPSARNLENEQPVHLVADGPVGEQVKRILKGKSVQPKASF